MQLTAALACLSLLSTTFAKTPDVWRSKSIYQVLTDRFAVEDGSSPECNAGERLYCGGSWKGIQNKLPYIQGMGFDAIWISPIVENFEELSQYGQAYHGYWTKDIYTLNHRFGTAQDLTDLITAAHDADMLVMLDVAINAMAYPGNHLDPDYSVFPAPFNSEKAYHQFCWIDYTNATSILQCWLGDDVVALMDVNTQLPSIRSTFQTWIKNIVSTYGFDGLRIDALKSIEVDFWPDFGKAAGAFTLGENYQADPTMNCAYQPAVDGLFNFPAYYGLFYAFNATGGGIQNLVNLIGQNQGNCSDTSLFGNFVENHDLPRYAGITSDQHQRINAIAFSFVMDGMPVVYYGQEQAFTGLADPYNREALWTSNYDTTNPYYTTIATLNAVRKNAISVDPDFTTTNTLVLYHDVDYLVLKKGDLLSCLFNDGVYGSNATMKLPLTGYGPNIQLIEVMTQNITSTDSTGGLTIKRNSGAPMIFFPYSKWSNNITKPNNKVEIDTRTTASTTMTTTYVYPTTSPLRSEGLLKASVSLNMLAVGLSLGAMVVTAIIFT